MQIDRERLILMALAALEELIDQAKDAPIQPSIAIRVALATAYAFSDGRRDPYDGFWREMQNPWSSQPSAKMSNYCRTTYMRTNMRGIIRGLGLPETPETDQRISRTKGRLISSQRSCENTKPG